MEYCADGTISDVSKHDLPENMIRTYTKQILVAVNVLHEKGIVHRDVKGKVLVSCNVMAVLNDSEHYHNMQYLDFYINLSFYNNYLPLKRDTY